MIDKIVGDAVHALFNAPLDLKDHRNAPSNAQSPFRQWSESFRRRPLPQSSSAARVSGSRAGPAIVGDVGIRSKLDYTAHRRCREHGGAARSLQQGAWLGDLRRPAAAARCDAALLRPLGQLAVRGRTEPIAVLSRGERRATHLARSISGGLRHIDVMWPTPPCCAKADARASADLVHRSPSDCPDAEVGLSPT